MDTQEYASFLTYTPDTLPPAQLLIGNHDYSSQLVEQYAQKLFCKNSACQTCTTCMQIRDRQHHALQWFYPTTTYTIELLEDLFTTITFRLQKNEIYLFILQKADFLTIACANKLLKSMEEPPQGYHFILLAERAEEIAPTIISRCVIHHIAHPHTPPSHHPLYAPLTTQKTTMSEFSKILDGCSINERESREVLDAILHYWITQQNNELSVNAQRIIGHIQQAYRRLPMPGSALIFWRNFYLHIKRLL